MIREEGSELLELLVRDRHIIRRALAVWKPGVTLTFETPLARLLPDEQLALQISSVGRPHGIVQQVAAQQQRSAVWGVCEDRRLEDIR